MLVRYADVSKTLIILVGASGSGKSSWSQDRKDSGSAVVCSADDGLIEADGVYRYAASKLPRAHRKCQAKARWAMFRGLLASALVWLFGERFSKVFGDVSLVVIDNTNTSLWAISPYVRMGRRFGYEVEVLVFRAVQDPVVLAERNRHGVSVEVIQKQLDGISKMLQAWPDSWPRYRVADLASVERAESVTEST